MNDADRVANAARTLVEAAGMRTAEENIRFLNDQLVELSDRLTTLEERVRLESLNPPAPEPDDDPLDLDACGPGTLLRDATGDWWFRVTYGWWSLTQDGQMNNIRPHSAGGPFTVVHRG